MMNFHKQFMVVVLALIFTSALLWAEDEDNFVLEIKGLDPGIDVIINGKQLGFTPFSQTLPRGETRLELRHPDWEPYVEILPPPSKKKLIVRPQLIHSRPYELRTLKEWRQRLADSIEKKIQTKATWDIVGYASLGTLGGGVLIAGGSAIIAGTIEPSYRAASSYSAASLYRSQIDGWNTMFKIGTGIGIAGLLGGVITLIFTPEIADLKAQLDSIDRQIQTLEVQN